MDASGFWNVWQQLYSRKGVSGVLGGTCRAEAFLGKTPGTVPWPVTAHGGESRGSRLTMGATSGALHSLLPRVQR